AGGLGAQHPVRIDRGGHAVQRADLNRERGRDGFLCRSIFSRALRACEQIAHSACTNHKGHKAHKPSGVFNLFTGSQFWNAAPAIQSRPEVPRFVFTGSTTNITLRTASSGAAAGWAALTGLKSSSASTRSWGETSMNIERRHRLHSPCPAVRSWTETRIGCAALTVTANRLNGATPPGVAYDSATNGGG